MTARARRNSVFAGFRDNGTQTSAINPSEVVMLDPSSIELFKDSQGREQPDALIPDKVKAIVASAKEIGIQQPAVVRLMDDGTYQMLTGRHRRFAAMELGIELPCQVLSNIDDELAYKIMAETNIPTEEKLPSEQGRIYKAYFDMRHDREDKAIVATLSVIFRVSDKTIYRYINVLRLPKALQDAVDAKIIAIKDFESLLNLTEQHLEAVGEYVDYFDVKKLTKKHIDLLMFEDGADREREWDKDTVDEILNPPPAEEEQTEDEPQAEVEEETIFDRIRAEFEQAEQLADEEIEQLIFGLLTDYYAAQDEADEYDD